MAAHDADPSGRRPPSTGTRLLGPVALVVVAGLGVSACSGSGEALEARPTAAGGGTSSTAPTSPPATSTPGAAPLALFFGDSYFVGGAYTTVEQDMARQAAERLGWTPVVRGGGGTGFTASNPEYDLPDYLGQIDAGALDVGARTVDWLVVEGGGNDKEADPALVEQNADAVLERAAGLHPEARVVLVGTMDPTVEDFTDTDAVNGALRRAADAAGVPFVDPQRWLEGRADLVGPDFDHPVPAGAALMGRNLADALAALTP